MKQRTGQIFFGALANEVRCQILRELEAGEKCVNDLVRSLKIKQSLVSHNLKILIKAGLVNVRRSGTFRYYTVNKQVVDSVFRLLNQWEEHRSGAASSVREDLHEAASSVPKNSSLHFFKIDKDGVVLMSQGAGFEGTGFVPGSDVGKHFGTSLGDMPEVIAAVNEGMSGKMVNKHVSGRGFIFGLRVLPLFDKTGQPNGCIGVVYDVSERLEMMWKLRAAEARWKALLMSMPARAVLVDARGRIQFINRPPALVPIEKVIGMSVYDWFKTAQAKALEETIGFVIETGDPKQIELMSSGDMEGRPTLYVGVVTPIANNGSKPKELVIVFKKIDEAAKRGPGHDSLM